MDAAIGLAEPEAEDRPAGGGRALATVLAATLLLRLIGLDQPIVENYVGRQVPTAMVARNLERGSGPLRPRLDTAPWPNYFLVEPPLYECGVVALRRATGLGLEESGRVLSAIATAVAGWGLFSMMRRRAGRRAAILAAGAFAAFPLTVRYGRAFQPDAAMLGAIVAGLACWDRASAAGRPAARRGWFAAGWVLLALGLAIKIIAAPLVIAMVLVGWRRGFGLEAGPRPRPPLTPPSQGGETEAGPLVSFPPLAKGAIKGGFCRGGARKALAVPVAAVAAMVPALLWYAWAAHLVASGGGSRASADNRAIWMGLLDPSALLRAETWTMPLRFLAIRAFTPIGAVLAILGLLGGRGSGLWRAWGLMAMATLAMLATKLHHEYYLLILAPAAAAGVGLALDRLAAGRGWIAAIAAAGLLIMAGAQTRSTWRTPPEWAGLGAASRAVMESTPADAWVVAPEALLFESDRRGCRLEWTEPAARRAAGEWGASAKDEVRGPIDLVEYYRHRGARYFADLGDRRDDPRRMALHDAVRRRYKVIVDRPEVIIADLEAFPAAGVLPHAN